MKEKDIIEGCIKGNRNAQKALYAEYGPRLMVTCIRYAGNREDAEEIFHDTMMKVYENIKKFKGESSLKTWVNRVGVNTALDFLRKRKNALMVEHISDTALEITDTEVEVEIDMDAKVAMQILKQLPLNQQIIINMYLLDDMSHREIALQLNISEEASRSQYSRAKRHLTELVKLKLNKNEQER